MQKTLGEQPLVSVIIPTKNSEATIERCLKSLKEQSYGNLEIIVVDNYSNDGTIRIAEKYGAMTFLKGPERSVQVNFGFEKAIGKYIYRVDSDFVLQPNVIQEAVEKCEREGCDAVVVHNTSDPTQSLWARIRKVERDCYKNDELNVAARFWRREVFRTLGGFDENLVAADDYDFHNRLAKSRFRIGRIQAEEVHIGEPKTLAEVVRKHYYYGKSIGRFIKKDPEKALKQLSPLRTSYARGFSEFLRDPTLMIGFGIYQFARYAATAAGTISRDRTIPPIPAKESMDVGLRTEAQGVEVKKRRIQTQPLVSVVVPTRNSGLTLHGCLSSMKDQTYPNIETIVVDSFSVDQTSEIAADYGARVIKTTAKRSEARNLGAKTTNGELVFFVDSDMELDRRVVEECVAKTLEGYDALIVPEISVGKGFWAKCRALEKLCYIGDDLIEGTRFFKKDVFTMLGGYDSQLEAGEDWDICIRARKNGFRITRIRGLIVHNEGRLSLRDSVEKKRYYAKTIDKYVQKHPDLAKKQLTLLRSAFVRNWKKMVLDPVHAVGLLGMKTCEFVAGRLSLVKNETRKEIETAQYARYARRSLEYRKVYLIDHFMPSGPSRFLDLGSGSGVYLPILARRGIQVVGLDASHDLCRLSKSHGFDVVVGDAMHLPFRDDVFDGVWASEVLEHLSSLNVLDDLEKIAKQCIVATIPSPYSRNYKADSSHKLRYTISSLRAFLKARTDWSYTVLGLGIEWPSAPAGVRLPKSVKLLSYYLTFYLPWLAPTICIAGYKKQERN